MMMVKMMTITTTPAAMPAFLTSPAYKTAINKHLVQTTLYQLSFHTILATTNTLFKPHSINCHFIQDWQSTNTLFKPHSINCHFIQYWQQQTPCSNTVYQLSFHTRLATINTLFEPHSINCHVIQDWKQ